MLTNLSIQIRRFLLHTFNIMFRTGFIPDNWRVAIVVPILKPEKPKDKAESYRPISLTSCMGKVMERMIGSRIKWHLERYNLLPWEQAGSRKRYSTSDHIVRLEITVNAGFGANKITAFVFLDLSSAYPNTWWRGLLSKLSRANIRRAVLR